MKIYIKNKGFTLIETLIGIGIFIIVSMAIYSSYTNVLNIFLLARIRSAATAVIQNEVEVIRNIPYPDVGTRGGIPSGNIIAQKVVNFGGASFNVKTNVKNVDDPFDGTLGGNPNDLIPADYKLVEVEVSCATSCSITPVKMTTTVAPKNVEKANKDGALFINVLDASGNPVVGANVSIVNNLVTPSINTNDVTNASGSLNFVDIATSSAGFHIVVTKSGYTSDQTYPLNNPLNPNPIKPDATVNEQDLTKITFAIDRVSNLNFKTQDIMCKPIPNISFNQTGEKLIGTNPDVPKYSVTSQTDATGQKNISNLEWDAFDFTNLSSSYDVSGTSLVMPLIVNPGENDSLRWVMDPSLPNVLLVTVLDEDNLPVNGATVNIVGMGVNKTQITRQRDFGQTDWSNNQYTSQTGSIETNNPVGQLTLQSVDGKYATASQQLTSSTFDMGTSNTTFYGFSWNPTSQPAGAGADSLKFQIATNNDNATWNFTGPNGNSNTYYNVSNTQIHSSNNGKRYLRYKVFMNTTNNQYTPTLQDIDIVFSSDCLTDGQAFFNGLSGGNYDITVSATGYDTTTDPGIPVTSGWQESQETLFVP